MTWRDLLIRIPQSIPENRLDEQAVFYQDGDGGTIIDEMETKSIFDDGPFDCTVGNDDGLTFVLIP